MQCHSSPNMLNVLLLEQMFMGRWMGNGSGAKADSWRWLKKPSWNVSVSYPGRSVPESWCCKRGTGERGNGAGKLCPCFSVAVCPGPVPLWEYAAVASYRQMKKILSPTEGWGWRSTEKAPARKTKLALHFGQVRLSTVILMNNTALHEDRWLFKWGFNKVSIAKAIYKSNLHRVLNK